MAKEKMIKLKGWEMQIKMIQFCCFANQSGKNLEELQHLLAEDDTGKQKFPCIFCGNEICYLNLYVPQETDISLNYYLGKLQHISLIKYPGQSVEKKGIFLCKEQLFL